MSGAAPAISAARPARVLPPERRLTMSKRIALGFLHTGALFREPGGVWRCRAFPAERVLDSTARALEQDGLAQMQEYEGHHGQRRACLSLTLDGIALYARAGGHLAGRRPPPVQAEGVLRETELALGEMAEQEARLAKALAAIDCEARETRAASQRLDERMAAIEAAAKRIDHERASLATSRQTLGAFTVQAAERIGAAVSEAQSC
ncbi:hypothetical protein ASE63_08290 [Bosea sp. Root381]|nr:hypothetical protein ASE63_08290 [Bosea sp. Root381]